MRGRKPTPSKLKLIKGNPGHRPLPPDEPKPEAVIPKCPMHLDKEAKAEWRKIAKDIKDTGIITLIDKAILALYCQSFSTWAKAMKAVHDEGMVSVNFRGVPFVNPNYKIATKAAEQMQKALIEMGMTPSSRSRVKVAEKPKEPEKKGAARFFK